MRPSGLSSGRSCTSICDGCSSVWSTSIVIVTAAPDDDDDDDDDDGIAEITPVATVLPSPVVLTSLPMASPVALLSLETSELRGVCLEEKA